MKSLTPAILAIASIALFTLHGCSSEGIDRNIEGQNRLLNPLADDADAQGNASLGSPLGTLAPTQFAVLDKLNFDVTLPSIISVLFRASDQFGNAIPNLQTTDFLLLEDDSPVSHTETSLSVVPHDELPFSLQTVIMIDVSSSIQPQDLEEIKEAVTALLMDDEGQSRLLPQQQIALYAFDDNVSLLSDFSSNSQNTVNALNTIQPAIAITPTDLYGAVVTGSSRWTDSFDISQITQGTMIVITDGTDTADRHSYQEALSAVANKSVYTLGVGNEISGQILSSIGTSGSYTLGNFSQLSAALQSINQQVVNSANSFYYLHYASPKRRAEGPAANSDHSIALSVNNNANTSSSGIISETFNSAEFSNVTAEVVLSGPTQIELNETAIIRATTRWAPSMASEYLWSLGEGNSACSLEITGSAAVRVTAVAEGQCTVQAQDITAGNARGWRTVSVISD